MKPTVFIIRAAGINCDRELAHAFTLAGAQIQAIHLNQLITDPSLLQQADLIGVPGGFSYGDDIAAGRIFANRLRYHLLPAFQEALGRGVPIIGICNGFQVLVKMGLLPDADGQQSVTLTDNTSGRFIDRWVRLVVPASTACIWTRGLDSFDLPIAHGEGRFVAAPGVLDRLNDRGQIALRYASDENPNGSTGDVAGICDPTGLILGLMPHPERHVSSQQHPHWTRASTVKLTAIPAGLRMFHNVLEHVRSTVNA